MERIDRETLTALVEMQSPGWARVGLAMPDPDLRHRAADAIAAVILDAIDPLPLPDPRQLPLDLCDSATGVLKARLVEPRENGRRHRA